jgi:two-component system phosphate regulon sensor histidine kinase PhoR
MIGLNHYASRLADTALDLQRASDFQAALLGMAGHDLRQPLQIIQSAYERAITKLTEQLDRLVSALRLYEHTQKMEITSVALAPLFWRIANENENDARENCIDIRVHPTREAIVSNPVLFEGVLRNLVRNAVKYTEPGGRILIGCRHVKDYIRIDVYDTGVGIAPEHLPQIFDAFQRLDSTRGDGLGIGLFVVRRAAAVLGHRVEVRSRVGRGSRFSIFARAAG